MAPRRASQPFAAALALAVALPGPLHAADLSLRPRASLPVAQWAAPGDEPSDTETAPAGPEAGTPFEDDATPADPVADPHAPAPARSSKQTDREYVWGPYSSRPGWKWVLFGTSTALLTISLSATLAIGIPVAQSNRRRGMLFEDLLAEARASLRDSDPNNDVDPDRVSDPCASEPGSGGALEITGPTSGQPPSTPMSEWRGVRNARVAEHCQRGRTWQRHTMRLAITTGALTLTTLATTLLLFVHRNPERMAQRRRFGIGAGPMATGHGAFIAGSGRF